jgi:hypothetical protein
MALFGYGRHKEQHTCKQEVSTGFPHMSYIPQHKLV